MRTSDIPGAEGAARALADRLSQALPDHLDKLSTLLALMDPLPHPVKVVWHDIDELGIDDYPTVLVMPVSTEGMEHIDVEGPTNGDTWRVTYRLNILAWVRSREGHAETSLLAMRYAAALRDCLLHRTRLHPWQDRDTGLPPAAVDPTSLREDYSPVAVDAAGRTIAAVQIRCDVHRVEHIDGPEPLGAVATTVVDGRAVGVDQPIHPALA